MVLGIGWPVWLTWLLVVFFVGDGIVSAIGPEPMREAFVNWGFPDWWHWVNAAVCLTIGILLAFEVTRPFGFLLGALECFAIYVTLIRAGEFAHLPPSIVLLALITLAYWGNYGWRLPNAGAA
ncbi:MAG: DoxX family protein [Devosia nanyangense]|nr:DoxX family protein [Devosia nanyangense]